MWEQGFLDASQMAGAFQLLRSNDLVWSRITREYLLGREGKRNDLMSWNADATRMPFRMHAEYLRKLFLDNELALGQFRVNGRAVSIGDIRVPLFVVATTQDHVSPWTSVYQIHLLADVPVTFVLAAGGHNGGIVSEPGHKNRNYRIACRGGDDSFLEAEAWIATAAKREGSWWPAWTDWLTRQSEGRLREIRGEASNGRSTILPEPLCDAPGTYVHEE